MSRVEVAFFATALTNKGSNLAESSSLATVRAVFMPSFIPGGVLLPPEKAWPTDSFSLDDERVR